MEEGWRRCLGDEWVQSLTVVLGPCRHWTYIGLKMFVWFQSDRGQKLGRDVMQWGFKAQSDSRNQLHAIRQGAVVGTGKGLRSPWLTISMSNSRCMAVQAADIECVQVADILEMRHLIDSGLRSAIGHQVSFQFHLLFSVLSYLLETSWSWCRCQAEGANIKIVESLFSSVGVATQQPE